MWIDSGLDLVVGTNKHHAIYMRIGVSGIKHTGTGWKRIPGGLKSVSTYGYYLWGVNKANAIYRAKFAGIKLF